MMVTGLLSLWAVLRHGVVFMLSESMRQAFERESHHYRPLCRNCQEIGASRRDRE